MVINGPIEITPLLSNLHPSKANQLKPPIPLLDRLSSMSIGPNKPIIIKITAAKVEMFKIRLKIWMNATLLRFLISFNTCSSFFTTRDPQ